MMCTTEVTESVCNYFVPVCYYFGPVFNYFVPVKTHAVIVSHQNHHRLLLYLDLGWWGRGSLS